MNPNHPEEWSSLNFFEEVRSSSSVLRVLTSLPGTSVNLEIRLYCSSCVFFDSRARRDRQRELLKDGKERVEADFPTTVKMQIPAAT